MTDPTGELAGSVGSPAAAGDTATDGVLTWRPVTPADFPLLGTWLASPRVARWWHHDPSPAGVERDFGPTARGEEPSEDLLVHLDQRPVGLVQRSVIGDYPDYLAEFAALTEAPADAVTLDYLVGEPTLLGRGLGPRIIAALVKDTWRELPTAPAVLVAVNAANRASWRALEKAGLTRVAEGEMEPDHPGDDRWHVVYRVDRPVEAMAEVGRAPVGSGGRASVLDPQHAVARLAVEEDVDARAAVDVVASGPAPDHVSARTGEDPVGSLAASHGVGALGAVDAVGTVATPDPVVTRSPDQRVVSAAPVDPVVAAATVDVVVAGAADQDVVGGAADEHDAVDGRALLGGAATGTDRNGGRWCGERDQPEGRGDDHGGETSVPHDVLQC